MSSSICILYLSFYTMLSADSGGLVRYIWTVHVVVFVIEPVSLILWGGLCNRSMINRSVYHMVLNMRWAWPTVRDESHKDHECDTCLDYCVPNCTVPLLSIPPSTTCFFRFILIIYSILRM